MPGPPDAKRARTEFVLEDEAEFLQRHPGTSKVRKLLLHCGLWPAWIMREHAWVCLVSTDHKHYVMSYCSARNWLRLAKAQDQSKRGISDGGRCAPTSHICQPHDVQSYG